MSLQSNLFREPVHGTWLITLIPTHTCSSHICRRRRSWCCSTHIWPRRMFWCCSTHIWPRRRFWCCWCLFLSCNLLHNLLIYEDFEWMLEFEICFYFKQFCRNQLKEGRKASRNIYRPSHVSESSSFGFYVFWSFQFSLIKLFSKNLATS